MISLLSLALHEKLHLLLAILLLTAGSASVAIADVTIDACVAQNSNIHPTLAADLQSLCALSSSVGALLGFSISGILVHLIGSKVLHYLNSLLFHTCYIENGLLHCLGDLLTFPFFVRECMVC